MKFFNQILITIGTLAVLAICVFFWISIQSSHFESQTKPFTIEYITNLSQTWKISDVEAKSSPDFLSTVSSDNGKEAIKLFKRFGRLIEISDFHPKHVTVSVGQTRGVYQFKASFTKTKAIGLIEIIEIESQLRVHGLRLNATEPLPTQESEFTA